MSWEKQFLSLLIHYPLVTGSTHDFFGSFWRVTGGEFGMALRALTFPESVRIAAT